MNHINILPLSLLICLALQGWSAEPDLLPLARAGAQDRLAAIATIGASKDIRWIAFLEDYRQGSAWLIDATYAKVANSASDPLNRGPSGSDDPGYLVGGTIVLILDPLDDGTGQPLHPLTRETLGGPRAKDQLTELPVRARERKAAGDAIDALRLSDPDPARRLNAVTRLGDAGLASSRDLLLPLRSYDSDDRVRRAATEGVAMIDLAAESPDLRFQAAEDLALLNSTRALDRLRDLALKDPDSVVKSSATHAVGVIEGYQNRIRMAQTAFSGLSAGSILIVMALGLAITFGLMGIINMAHGEMLMIGAYASLLVFWGFQKLLPPDLIGWYFPVGIVAGFVAAGAVGWLLELVIIRHLYGRPLETLLATWGIGYVLIQGIRQSFGDNQAVTAPGWLVGGWEPVPDLVLPYNRLFIIALTACAVVAVWLLLSKTRLGLLLRATTQSRRTAASLGVDTRRIDGLTFALGSGLAGAAGVALTLIGGLKPDMGQEFIIDSFLVVAAGGVGNLAGVVWAGLGLGLGNKLLEPFVQTVWAKVLILGLVILFLQFRPQGLFPPRGRLADAG